MISTPAPEKRRQQRADPVQHEASGEASFAAPAVGQLAAGDHQDRHDQQEQGDRRLHSPTVVSRSAVMSLIITFMFEPAKLHMN